MENWEKIKYLEYKFEQVKNLFIENTFQLIIDLHSDPRRQYHNIDHLVEIFRKFDKNPLYRCNLDDIIATFFHDIFYTCCNGIDEEMSKKILFSLSNSSNSTIIDAANTIEATKDHLLSLKSYKRIFIAFDLSILWSNEEEYKKYSENIIKEVKLFKSIPDNMEQVVLLGRKAFIQKMLSDLDNCNLRDFKFFNEQRLRSNFDSELLLLDSKLNLDNSK